MHTLAEMNKRIRRDEQGIRRECHLLHLLKIEGDRRLAHDVRACEVELDGGDAPGMRLRRRRHSTEHLHVVAHAQSGERHYIRRARPVDRVEDGR